MLASRVLREPFVPDWSPFDNLFQRFFGMSGVGAPNRVTEFAPVLDVQETDTEYYVLVDLPGVKKEDVSIEFENSILTISGVRSPVEFGETKRSERPYGSFVRSLTLPQGVDVDSIVADYHDGVLELRVPKPAGLTTKKIEIASGQKALTS